MTRSGRWIEVGMAAVGLGGLLVCLNGLVAPYQTLVTFAASLLCGVIGVASFVAYHRVRAVDLSRAARGWTAFGLLSALALIVAVELMVRH